MAVGYFQTVNFRLKAKYALFTEAQMLSAMHRWMEESFFSCRNYLIRGWMIKVVVQAVVVVGCILLLTLHFLAARIKVHFPSFTDRKRTKNCPTAFNTRSILLSIMSIMSKPL